MKQRSTASRVQPTSVRKRRTDTTKAPQLGFPGRGLNAFGCLRGFSQGSPRQPLGRGGERVSPAPVRVPALPLAAKSPGSCRRTAAFGEKSRRAHETLSNKTNTMPSFCVTDPQTGVALGIESQRTAMCVRSVNVRVSCSSHIVTHFAAVFIDPRAK